MSIERYNTHVLNLDTLKQRLPDQKIIKMLLDVRNIGMYLFALLAISVTWSSVRALQQNFKLQQQIAVLQQQNAINQLENETIALRNKYLQSDEYIELEARRQTGKGLPGEKAILIPKDAAIARTIEPLPVVQAPSVATTQKAPWYIQNTRDWLSFLGGKLRFQ